MNRDLLMAFLYFLLIISNEYDKLIMSTILLFLNVKYLQENFISYELFYFHDYEI